MRRPSSGDETDGGAADLPPEPAALAGREFSTRIRDHEIHALEYGEGERTLLLLHGLSGSSRWWSRNLPELSAEFRVVVPDLIGFGRSRSVGRLPEIAEVARLLLEWLDRLDLAPLSLVGHSMGGQIGIHLAVAAPDRFERLMLVDSAGIPRPLGPRSVLRFAAEVGPLWRWGDPTFIPIIARDAWVAGPRVLLRALAHILDDDVRPLLPLIRIPTLIIWGERDTLIPLSDAMEFRDRIPQARLAVLRGAAHNPMVDRPADFNRLLRRFVAGEQVGR